MSGDPRFLLIRNFDLWGHLSDEEYDALSIQHCYIEAKKGQYIYFEAYNHNKLYFLKKGFIRVGTIDDVGKQIIREILRSGEIFGQFTLEKNNLQGEFAQAYKEDVSLCAFDIRDFERLLQSRPEISLKFSKQVGNQLFRIQNRLNNLLHKDVRTRLIEFLFAISNQEDNSSGSIVIRNYLTHEDIGHLIGCSRQTATTLINEMESVGLLEFNRKEIVIPSVKDLQKTKVVG